MIGHDAVVVPPETSGRLGAEASTGMAFASRWRSSKVRDEHLGRWAIVYVRQSTPQQVSEHKESRERQYALVGHALALGWPPERIQVIDEDQGRSARSMAERLGFQRSHIGMTIRF